ncbi:hypothetical protein DFP72DRAFT_1063544 [Ephemerocybe angulata]|uniref:Uncharacterized protein n=1 Tax=Ephemerocybe angulata TaxID=980116 RepID=A0A8H6I8H5_9AGAR|nr:hypothetical protein DFP72DRAFT_1063544 [Tulosesus angulatus]
MGRPKKNAIPKDSTGFTLLWPWNTAPAMKRYQRKLEEMAGELNPNYPARHEANRDVLLGIWERLEASKVHNPGNEDQVRYLKSWIRRTHVANQQRNARRARRRAVGAGPGGGGGPSNDGSGGGSVGATAVPTSSAPSTNAAASGVLSYNAVQFLQELFTGYDERTLRAWTAAFLQEGFKTHGDLESLINGSNSLQRGTVRAMWQRDEGNLSLFQARRVLQKLGGGTDLIG